MFDKLKKFFQAALVSIRLYGCITWTLSKRMEKNLDSNYTRMLRAILNKSWRQTQRNSSCTATYHPSRKPYKLDKLLYTTRIHMQTQANTNAGRLCCSGTNFLTSVLRHEVSDTILSMQTIPNVQRILWCLRFLSVEIRKTQRHLQQPKPNSQLTLFQNPQILRTISL